MTPPRVPKGIAAARATILSYLRKHPEITILAARDLGVIAAEGVLARMHLDGLLERSTRATPGTQYRTIIYRRKGPPT